jgi:hypothetical protein
MVALHDANQALMKRRWERDQRLAELRQLRVDEESRVKLEAWNRHMTDIAECRERRGDVLVKTSGSSSEGNTQARLEKAKNIRSTADETLMSKTSETLAKVEKRREEHQFGCFLKQVTLANRALDERIKASENVQRSQALDEARISNIEAHLTAQQQRCDEVRHTEGGLQQSAREARATQRDTNHLKARTARVNHATTQELKREKARMERNALEDEREERFAVARQEKADASLQRSEKQQDVLRKVSRMVEDQQSARDAQQRAKQEKASQRIQRLQEIRSLLEA